jgi:hypothetical protein
MSQTMRFESDFPFSFVIPISEIQLGKAQWTNSKLTHLKWVLIFLNAYIL